MKTKSRLVAIFSVLSVFLSLSVYGNDGATAQDDARVAGHSSNESGTRKRSDTSIDRLIFSKNLDFLSDSEGNYRTVLKIKNPNDESARVVLNVAGYLFKDRTALLAAIRQMPDLLPGESDYMKAWRLISARHYHADPIIAGTKTHDPFLALNSIGYGYCDDVAAALAIIWQWLGYESRVWVLQGHVVPEVKVDGVWHMLDPDYGIYYLDNAGAVASVDTLSQNPSLISQPVNPIWEPDFDGYATWLAAIYDGREADDNYFVDTPVIEEHPAVIDMPAGASLEFPFRFEMPVLSYYGTAAPLIGAAQLNLEAGSQGELKLPLVVIDVSGNGSVEVDGQVYEVGTPALNRYLRGDAADKTRPSNAVTRINVLEARSPLTVTMAMNPMVTYGAQGTNVQVFQPPSSPHARITLLRTDGSPFSRIGQWFLRLFEHDADKEIAGLSPVSELLSSVSLDALASPVKLAPRLEAVLPGRVETSQE